MRGHAGVTLIVASTMLALGACDRTDPPVNKLERAAEELVGDTDKEALPHQPQGPFAPRDECTDQPGASEFLANLRRAVLARDAQTFAALAAEDIRLDFGGGSGRETLVERLGDENYNLWEAAEEVLTLGCAADGATLTMPWYFAQDTRVDPFEGYIVTGENVPLHPGPEPDPLADAVTVLSWDVVTIAPGTDLRAEYLPVRYRDPQTATEMAGYVARDKLRSVIDYRIGAARRNNQWRMTYFIAGD